MWRVSQVGRRATNERTPRNVCISAFVNTKSILLAAFVSSPFSTVIQIFHWRFSTIRNDKGTVTSTVFYCANEILSWPRSVFLSLRNSFPSLKVYFVYHWLSNQVINHCLLSFTDVRGIFFTWVSFHFTMRLVIRKVTTDLMPFFAIKKEFSILF